MEQTTGSMKWESRYSNMSKNEFKTLILMNKEKSRYDYVYFILNTLLQIFMTIVVVVMILIMMILKMVLNVKFAPSLLNFLILKMI